MPDEEKTKAPAVHGSELWGGPRLLENATEEPVYVETKQEYWDLLNKTGHRMKDQQESSTGPEREPPPTASVPAWLLEGLKPFTRDDAELFAAITGVYRRYGIKEGLWCDRCLALGVENHGCRRAAVSDKGVIVECRCGVREYCCPPGTTDLPFNRPNTAMTLNDRSQAVITATDRGMLPATLMAPEDVTVMRAFLKRLAHHQLSARWFCSRCWRGGLSELDAMWRTDSPEKFALLCSCRMLYG